MTPKPLTTILIDPPSAFASFEEIRDFIIECGDAISAETSPEAREIFERERAEAFRILPAAIQRRRQELAASRRSPGSR